MLEWRRQATPLATVLLAFGLRLWDLGSPSLWEDEAWTAAIATRPVMESYHLALADGVHPPLYYAIMRAAVLLAPGEWGLRFPSALVGVLAVALIFRLARSIWGNRIADWATVFAAVQPFAVWYAQEARQYSLLICLATTVMLAFLLLEQARTRSRWAFFVLVSALAYLTHYFALLLPFLQFLYLAISLRRNHAWLTRWAGAQVLAAIPVTIWVLLFLALPERNLGIAWLQRPDITAIPGTLWRFTFFTSLPLAVTAICSAVALGLGWLFARRPPARWTAGRQLVALWLFAPILTVWLISQRRPFYNDRFLIVSFPAAMLILAAGLGATRRRSLRWILGLSFTALSLWSVLQLHGPDHAKEDWRRVGEWLAAEMRVGDVVVLPDQKMSIPLSYYAEEAPFEITLDYWNGLPALQRWGQAYRRLWVIFYDRSQAWDLLADRESFATCEQRHPMGLVIYICPAGSTGSGDQLDNVIQAGDSEYWHSTRSAADAWFGTRPEQQAAE